MRVDMRVRVESGTPSPRQIERAQRCAACSDETDGPLLTDEGLPTPERLIDSRPAASRDPPGEPAL